jgi:hypothetical protein
MTRINLSAALLASATLLLAGCGGSTSNGAVAHLGSNTGSSATTGEGAASPGASSPEATALAFASCMRSRGVPNFPDPTASGVVHLGPGVDPTSPTFREAQQACRKLLPNGAKGGAASPSEQARMLIAALKFSQCMRTHGVPSFPDPSASGGVKMEKDSGIVPSSPQFRAAQKTCQSNLPRPPGAKDGPDNGGPESGVNAVRIP